MFKIQITICNMNFRHLLFYSDIIIVLSLAQQAVIAGPPMSPRSKGLDYPFSLSYES